MSIKIRQLRILHEKVVSLPLKSEYSMGALVPLTCRQWAEKEGIDLDLCLENLKTERAGMKALEEGAKAISDTKHMEKIAWDPTPQLGCDEPTLWVPRTSTEPRCHSCGCTEGHRMNCPNRPVWHEGTGYKKAGIPLCNHCDASRENPGRASNLEQRIDPMTVVHDEAQTFMVYHEANCKHPGFRQRRKWETVKEGAMKYQVDKNSESRINDWAMPRITEERSPGIGVSAINAKPLPELRQPATNQINDNYDAEDLLCADADE